MVFPAFVDMHTHLDKGHIWPRSPNPDGTFMGALTTVRADSAANWSAEDVRPRMSFSLRSAYAHGTRAIRTHLDSIPPQDDITWPVFRELQADWADRIALQAVCLIGCDGGRMTAAPSATPPIWWPRPRAACWAWSPTPCPTCATG
jgi:cytosine deaminase